MISWGTSRWSYQRRFTEGTWEQRLAISILVKKEQMDDHVRWRQSFFDTMFSTIAYDP